MRSAIPQRRARGPKFKRVKLPPPTQLLFGHGVIPGRAENGRVVAQPRVGLVVSPAAGTAEAHAVKHGVLKAHFDAARAMRSWPVNAEVREQDFLDAVRAAAEAKVGAFPEGRVRRAPKPAPAPPPAVLPSPPAPEAGAAEAEVK